MIVTVTPNLALDITYTLDQLVVGSPMRVADVRERAGGKGVNVARVLRQQDVDVQAIAMCGGNNGRTVAAELADAGLPACLVPIAGETRRAIAVVDRLTGEATVFNEVGPMITTSEWARFEAAVAASIGAAEVLVVSGSLPPGAPADGHARIVRVCREVAVPVIVDATGEALLSAAEARPDVVKPNEAELLAATGAADIASGAQVLLDLGAGAVVVSLGAAGAVATTRSQTGSQTWTVRLPQPVHGNATGAGDAMVAALAIGIARGWSWPQRLGEAVALSAAAVAHPQAGSYDEDTYARALGAIEAARL